MVNRVAGCQPPAGATPLLRCGLPHYLSKLGRGGGGDSWGGLACRLGGGGYWRYGRGGVPRGGGGFLNTMQFPCFSKFSRSSVAMVCH